jgi:hypothetical protein
MSLIISLIIFGITVLLALFFLSMAFSVLAGILGLLCFPFVMIYKKLRKIG